MSAPRSRGVASRERPLYPADHAFVIALRSDADLDGGELAGRVEHVSSGRAVSFQRLDALLEFIRSATGERSKRRTK